jgi:hypothetical protein
LDELVSDLQLFSSVLAKLGFVHQAGEVDIVTSDLLLHAKVRAADGGASTKPHQRKALLIKAKALVVSLQESLGDMHPHSPALARISYELKQEIEES